MIKKLFIGLLALITMLIVYIFGGTASDPAGATGVHGGFDEAMAKKAKRHKAALSLDLLKKTEELLQKPYVMELFENAPLYIDVGDIDRKEKYASSRDILKLSHHNGQVKLLLTEIQFLTLVLEKYDSPAYVVYAGSAPSHKLSILLNLFPGVKFILVDPNEHQIMYPDYGGMLAHTKPTAYRVKSQYDQEYITNMVYFRAAAGNRFRLNGRKINLYTDGAVKVVSRPEDGAGGITPDIPDFIEKHPGNLFVIEDYMTDSLAEILHKLSGKAAGLYFISDIRSTAEGEFPSNEHVVWNNILHYSWLKRLGAKTFMLKYHPPYNDGEKLKYADYMTGVFAEYPVDKDVIEKELIAGKYTYIKSDHMYIQSFAPQSSSEVRLIGSSLDLVQYDIVDFEDKMYYYNTFHRNIGNCRAHDKYVSFADSVDNCPDCAIMCHIIAEYYKKYYNTDNRQTVLGLIRMILFTIGRDLSGNSITHAMDKMSPTQPDSAAIAQNIYKRYALMEVDPKSYTRAKNPPTLQNQAYKAAAMKKIAEIAAGAGASEAARSIQESAQTFDLFGGDLFFELDMMLKLHQNFEKPEEMFKKIRAALTDKSVPVAPPAPSDAAKCRKMPPGAAELCAAACPWGEKYSYSGASRQLDAEIDFILTKYELDHVVEIGTLRTSSYFDLVIDGYTPPRSPKNTKYTNFSIYGGDHNTYRPDMKTPHDALVILSTVGVSELVSKFIYRNLVANNPKGRILAISGENIYNGDGKLLVDTQCAAGCKKAKCRPMFVNYVNINLQH